MTTFTLATQAAYINLSSMKHDRLFIGLLTFAVAAAASAPAPAAERRILPKYNVGGFIKVPGTTAYRLDPGDAPRVLGRADDALMKARGNTQAVEDARAFMKKFPETTGMLLLDRGKVIFQAYQGVGKPTSEFYSMSVGKSMTSLAVGQALCSGLLPSLEAKAGMFVPELKANRLGASTVRQLLMMSSGAYKSIHAGGPQYTGGLGRRPRNGKPFQGASWPMRLGQVNVGDLLWGFGWERTENKNHALPGETFMYKSVDTLSLGMIIERVTAKPLAAYFEETVWRKVRPAHAAHWETDALGSTMANSGFQARLSDWGRIALWVLEERQKPGCFGDYLRDATTMQIATASPLATSGPAFQGYGYQWWVKHRNAPGFWGMGFAGQNLGINPETGKVLIKFGYRTYNGVAAGVFRLFRKWNRNNR